MKTKIRSLVLFLFAVQSIFAQDYACIKPLDTVYFNHHYYPISNSIYVPVIIENTTISNDTIYHQNITDWAFRNITVAPDGVTLFTNNELDTISIHTQASINDTWRFYTSPTDNNLIYVDATVTDISTQTFIGITDEVKTITLTSYDSSGNSHVSGNILISKNHGFVHVPNLSLFPSGGSMDLIAYNEPNFNDFGATDIFNFDVGDEIHTTEEIKKWFTDDWDYYHTGIKIIRIVIAKDISEDGTEITYTYDGCSKSIFEMWKNLDNTSDVNSQTIDFLDPEIACYNQISTTSHDYIDENGYCKRIVVGADSDSKFIISIAEGYDLNNLTFTFPNFDPHFPYGYAYHYKIGYGGPYYFHEYHMNWFESRYLSNHISCSHLLETEEIAINNNFSIYPNPVNNKLHISLNNENSFTQYSLFITDLTGKRHIVLKQNLDEFTIDTSKLVDGLYIMQLVSEKRVLTRKFMVRH